MPRRRHRAGMTRFKAEFMTGEEAVERGPRTDRWVIGIDSFASPGSLDSYVWPTAKGIMVAALDVDVPGQGILPTLQAFAGEFDTPDPKWADVLTEVAWGTLSRFIGDAPHAHRRHGWRHVVAGAFATAVLEPDVDAKALLAEINRVGHTRDEDRAEGLERCTEVLRDHPGVLALGFGVIICPDRREIR